MASTENISVHVRVRPLNDAEKDKGRSWKVEGNTITALDSASSDNGYSLDTIFDGASTEQVYKKTAQGLINQVVNGFNSTVFAYGQTSSGKTHTMRGTEQDPGIVPRAVKDIFNLISSNPDREFLLRVSYMELYNEDINDLLAPENQKLSIHENKEAGIHVAGLREEIVSSPEQVLSLLEEGERFRHIGETKMNKASSRSHTIFRMVIESRSTELPSAEASSDFGAIRVSTLTLVDLAGSERISKTGAEGQRMKEGAAINKSLLTLGTVINKLSEGVQLTGGHIPYRDSKLTRILQPSLGGNAKTAIICNITPAFMHVEESHSTLRFACRAKRVVNNATVNEVLSDAAVLKRQAKEIEELRHILQSTGNTHIDEEIGRLRAELLRKDQDYERMQFALAAEKEERERAQRKVDNMTKLMMHTGRSGSPGAGTTKPKRDNRRDTWCPGAARKRALLPANQLASLLEDGTSNGTSASMMRRSDGAALGLYPSSGVSPPLKMPRGSTDATGGENDELVAPQRRPSNIYALGGGNEELNARIRELEKANELMQRELDAVADAAQVTQKQLKDAEDELVSVADERDAINLKLKEAEWKARQAEREAGDAVAERDAAVEVATAAEAALEELQQTKGAVGGQVEGLVGSLKEEVDALKQRVEEAEAAKEALERQLADAVEESKMYQSKAETRKAALQELEKKLGAQDGDVGGIKAEKEEAEARCAEAEARARDLYEEVTRLNSHISDLESRKRAPLYQKRQEDELRAVTEKAAEAEVRAVEAEMLCKEARAAQETAEKELQGLKLELERLQTEATEEAAHFATQKEAWAQRAAADAEKAAAKHEEAITAIRAEHDAIVAAKAEVEAQLEASMQQVQELTLQMESAQEALESVQAQLEETQQCADAAATHVRFLEEKAEEEAAAHEAVVKELNEKIDGVHVTLANVQQEFAFAMEQAKAEKEALEAVNVALEATKTDLEARIAEAAGALNAADELKELKRKYKDETLRLNQQLKAASLGSKGNEKVVGRAQKDIERLRNQIKDLEGKLKVAIQDKNNAQMDKAGVERELRTFKAQHEKLSKNMDKIHGMEERKRESIMVGLNQTKSRLQLAEDALHKVQVDFEKCQFELENKTGECTRLETELEEAKTHGEEASRDRDELSDKLVATEEDLAAVKHEADALRESLATCEQDLATATERGLCLRGAGCIS